MQKYVNKASIVYIAYFNLVCLCFTYLLYIILIIRKCLYKKCLPKSICAKLVHTTHNLPVSILLCYSYICVEL